MADERRNDIEKVAKRINAVAKGVKALTKSAVQADTALKACILAQRSYYEAIEAVGNDEPTPG